MNRFPQNKIQTSVISSHFCLQCYDVRFPEFSLSLARMGADIITYPSAFTVTTGLAHWESLLRARAIETQCCVVAAAQTGIHNSKRSSYGHAMVSLTYFLYSKQTNVNSFVYTILGYRSMGNGDSPMSRRDEFGISCCRFGISEKSAT